MIAFSIVKVNGKDKDYELNINEKLAHTKKMEDENCIEIMLEDGKAKQNER